MRGRSPSHIPKAAEQSAKGASHSQNTWFKGKMQNSPTAELESCLKAFVNWSLEQSYSNQPLEANLQLLNCAWKAQKLLWKLRRFSTQ